MESQTDSGPKAGLRERKKARTRAEIQRQALRLFRERGYEATTVARIAEAAEVSESTFFRYFPTKEDVVLWDEFDPLIFEAFKAQPAEADPIRALRDAIRAVLARTSPTEREQLRERVELLLSVPPLRAALGSLAKGRNVLRATDHGRVRLASKRGASRSSSFD